MSQDESNRYVGVRVTPETYAALEKRKREMEKKAGGVELTLSQVVRTVLEDALGVAR